MNISSIKTRSLLKTYFIITFCKPHLKVLKKERKAIKRKVTIILFFILEQSLSCRTVTQKGLSMGQRIQLILACHDRSLFRGLILMQN